MRNPTLKTWIATLIGLFVLDPSIQGSFAPSSSPPRIPDLDVAIPPGTPYEWKRQLPRPLTRRETAVPTTKRRSRSEERYAKKTKVPQHRFPTATSQRLVSLDVGAHLTWTNPPRSRAAKTGSTTSPYPPVVSPTYYWLTLTMLLRMMLHPEQTSRTETMGTLLEIGEPALPALRNGRTEGALANRCKELIAAIGKMPADRPRPPKRSTETSPFDTMMGRFVTEELIKTYAYDPELKMSRTLVLLGKTAAPYLGLLTKSDHSFARRNAISALSQLPDYPATPSILLQVLKDQDNDLVSWMRAVSALGALRSYPAVDPLIEELDKCQNDVLGSALVHSLGLIGHSKSQASLVSFARRRPSRDVFMSVMIALLRLDPLQLEKATVVFLKSKLQTTQRSPGTWKVQKLGSLNADYPDRKNLRAEIAGQLISMVLSKNAPDDDALRQNVMKLTEQNPPKQVNWTTPKEHRSFGAIHRSNYYAFVDYLRTSGGPGLRHLMTVVRDATVSSDVRAYALWALPVTHRAILAKDVLSSARQDDATVRGYSFELLETAEELGSSVIEEDELVRTARSLPLDPAATSLMDLDSDERYLHLLSLRALGTRGKLSVERVIHLAKQLDQRPIAPDEIRRNIALEIDRLLELARDSRQSKRMRAGIHRIMNDWLEKGFRTKISDQTRDQAVKYIEAQLKGIQTSPGSASLIKESVLAYFLGIPQRARSILPSRSGETRIEPQVPLEETLILELGRLQDKKATRCLIDLLANKSHPHRGAICLALAATRERTAAMQLVYSLEDPVPFVRLCAYLGLKQLTGQDYFVDWIYGKKKHWTEAKDRYALWIHKNFSR